MQPKSLETEEQRADKLRQIKEGNAYIKQIQSKVGTSVYALKNALPTIIRADVRREVQINKNAMLDPDLDESIHNNTIKTNKFLIESGGDWDFYVRKVKISHFSSREDFDAIVLERTHPVIPEIIPHISIAEAFKKLGVTISANIEELLKTATEDQKEKYEVNYWIHGKKQRDEKILNSLLWQLFGPNSSSTTDEHDEPFVTDLRLHFQDGNAAYATAVYGNFYLFLEYNTS